VTLSKYAGLTVHLSHQPIAIKTLVLSFEELERILDSPLPPSARKHRPWWANQARHYASQARGWMDAGFLVKRVDIRAGEVVLWRDSDARSISDEGGPYSAKERTKETAEDDSSRVEAFGPQLTRLISDLEDAHQAYYKSAVFSGPSLHFHLKALQAGKEKDLDQFSESVYALLCAWGMHRMGKGGAKMCDFDVFYTSLRSVWAEAVALQEKLPATLQEKDWSILRHMFISIRCMNTRTSLVGNSKVMAHLLPNLVPPVDRQYTLRYLYRNGTIKNDLDSQWRMLEMILRHFFYPVLKHPAFQSAMHDWSLKKTEYRWDTSPIKAIDNLVIGLAHVDRKMSLK
jgi:hypothetical protein